jgi:hypothetical protein
MLIKSFLGAISQHMEARVGPDNSLKLLTLQYQAPARKRIIFLDGFCIKNG